MSWHEVRGRQLRVGKVDRTLPLPRAVCAFVRTACWTAVVLACGSRAADAPKTPAAASHVDAAVAALKDAATRAAECRSPGGPVGEGQVRVNYSPSGEVQSVVILTRKFRAGLVGSCVRTAFRQASIAPFRGDPHMFVKSFVISE